MDLQTGSPSLNIISPMPLRTCWSHQGASYFVVALILLLCDCRLPLPPFKWVVVRCLPQEIITIHWQAVILSQPVTSLGEQLAPEGDCQHMAYFFCRILKFCCINIFSEMETKSEKGDCILFDVQLWSRNKIFSIQSSGSH